MVAQKPLTPRPEVDRKPSSPARDGYVKDKAGIPEVGQGDRPDTVRPKPGGK